jgi:hypothetical protein
MSALKKVFALIAIAALFYFAPQIGASLAGSLLGAGAGVAASGFLASVIGSIVVAVGIFAIQSILGPGSGKGSEQEGAKINVRLAEPLRWHAAGRMRQGGGVLFAEYDDSGNFWYLIVHADTILTDEMTLQYYLDDVAITVDGSGLVQTKDFRLKDNKEKDPAETDGEGDDYVQIWTTTHSETDPSPPGIAAFKSANPQWTDDHVLAGTTYSVIKMFSIETEHRYKIFRWRGPIGLGEPSLSVVGIWANMYDPRDETQTLGDRSTYKPSRNAALVWAWFRTHRYGRNKSESSINWDKVEGAQATS